MSLSKSRITVPCIVIAAFVGYGPWAHAELLDAVAATVDTEVILYSEIEEMVAPVLDSLRASGLTEAQLQQEAQQARQETLEQAVDQKILYREAMLLGLASKVNRLDELVDEQLDKVRQQYDSNEAFMRMVQEAGETLSDFRARLRKKILALAMAQNKFLDFERQAVISESEMAQYYQDHKSEFVHPEQAKVRLIFLAAGSEPAERAKVKARMAALKQEIELGADFAELARLHSEGPQAEKGGLLGWVKHDPDAPELVPELDNAVAALPVGGVSEVIETQYGFHLAKVEERRPAGTETLDMVRTQIEPKLREAQAAEHYEKWMSDLRKRSRVRIFPL